MGVVSGVVHAAEFRILAATSIEDYHAHLLRLDRSSIFPGDRTGIDAHCLHLLSRGAILIGAYVKGVMRGAAEIVPDRTARRAEAAITIEDDYQDRDFDRTLTSMVIEEARRYHLREVRIQEQSATRCYKVPAALELHSYAANG